MDGMDGSANDTASVAEHYARAGLAQRILDAFAAEGTAVTVASLAAVDEFHTGGRRATAELTARLGLNADSEVLDVGCGIGGTARHIATEYNCRVTGVDLTEAYVEAAGVLTDRVGLAGQVSFRTADALRLPFDAGGFDAVCAIHVGMNIADKAAWFAEAARVLRPGGHLGLLELVRTGAGEVHYPTPWASCAATSFLLDPAGYRAAFAAAGLRLVTEHDRRAEALEQLAARPAQRPALGTHLLMDDLPGKQAHVIAALQAGTLAPFEFVATKP